MPLGYVPSSKRAPISVRLFGSRRFSRAVEFRIISRWLGPTRGLALDLGAGNGEFAAQLAHRGYRVVALDLDRRSLQVGQAEGLAGIHWVAGDATRLPFASGRFDLVLCNSAIEHFPDDVATIGEVARVIKRGGQIILTTDSMPRASRWLRFIPMSWRRDDLRVAAGLDGAIAASHRRRHAVQRFYDAARLTRLLSAAGLRVESWRYYLNDPVSKGIFELHLVLSALDFYNHLSRRLYPLFVPFTFPLSRRRPGYGLAVRARRAG